MERLQRLAYYLGIGMVSTLFTLLLIMVVPNLAQDAGYDAKTDDDILAMFTTHPAYLAMYERYPNAVEEFEVGDHGDASLRVGVMDFESGVQLVLFMNAYRDHVGYVNVECVGNDEDPGTRVDGLFAAEFIRVTDCIEPAT